MYFDHKCKFFLSTLIKVISYDEINWKISLMVALSALSKDKLNTSLFLHPLNHTTLFWYLHILINLKLHNPIDIWHILLGQLCTINSSLCQHLIKYSWIQYLSLHKRLNLYYVQCIFFTTMSDNVEKSINYKLRYLNSIFLFEIWSYRSVDNTTNQTHDRFCSIFSF